MASDPWRLTMRRLAALVVLVTSLALAATGCKPGHPGSTNHGAGPSLPISLDGAALQITAASTEVTALPVGAISSQTAVADMKSSEPAFYAHLELAKEVSTTAVHGL